MNWYADLAGVKAFLGIAVSTHDAVVSGIVEGLSRELDRECRRHFYVWEGVRYFDSPGGRQFVLPDVLSVSAVGADSELDGTYDGEAWVEGTDFYLRPDNRYPKRIFWVPPWGDKCLAARPRYLKVTGVFGFGDGTRAMPYDASGLTGTVADGTSTTLVASATAAGVIEVGHTVRVESEQMFVEAVDAANLTVKRGVNGTVAAAHSGVSILVYAWPKELTLALWNLADMAWREKGAKGLQSRQIGAYMEMWMQLPAVEMAKKQMLGKLRDHRILAA